MRVEIFSIRRLHRAKSDARQLPHATGTRAAVCMHAYAAQVRMRMPRLASERGRGMRAPLREHLGRVIRPLHAAADEAARRAAAGAAATRRGASLHGWGGRGACSPTHRPLTAVLTCLQDRAKRQGNGAAPQGCGLLLLLPVPQDRTEVLPTPDLPLTVLVAALDHMNVYKRLIACGPGTLSVFGHTHVCVCSSVPT